MLGPYRSPHGRGRGRGSGNARPEGAIEALTRLSQARSSFGQLVDQRRTSVCVFSHQGAGAGAEAEEDAIRLSRFASGRVTQDDIASDTLKRKQVNRCRKCFSDTKPEQSVQDTQDCRFQAKSAQWIHYTVLFTAYFWV